MKSKKMAKNAWLFLTNDKMPKKAKVNKKAFIHEVSAQIELCYAKAKSDIKPI